MQETIAIAILMLARVAAAMVGLSIVLGFLFFGFGGTPAEFLELLAGLAAGAVSLLSIVRSRRIQKMLWCICALVSSAYAVLRLSAYPSFGPEVVLLPAILLSCVLLLGIPLFALLSSKPE